MDQEFVLLGVSSCLIGNRVRYDGEHKYQPLITQHFTKGFKLIPFCPEMEIGLGVPREKIQLVDIDDNIRCFDQKTLAIEYTDKLAECCDSQEIWLTRISGYILKTKSPSCGVTKVNTLYGNEMKATGQGIFANELMRRYPDLPLIEEDQLASDKARAAFVAAVNSYTLRHFG